MRITELRGPINDRTPVVDFWRQDAIFYDEGYGDENRAGDSEGVGQMIYEMSLPLRKAIVEKMNYSA